MRKLSLPYLLSLLLVIGITSCKKEIRPRKQSFNANWEFHRGDIEDPFSTHQNEHPWRKIDLPHDWSIEGMYPVNKGMEKIIFSKESYGEEATGHTLGGVSWYRKHFTISDTTRLYSLYFDGVYMESEVWVNGKKALFHPNGYTPFFCQLNPYLNEVGEENTVAVKVSNIGKNSRWYSGSGIYRHVWLISTNLLHFDDWSVFIKTDSVSEDKAYIKISADVMNQKEHAVNPNFQLEITDRSGNIVGICSSPLTISSNSQQTIYRSFEIENPDCWSPDTPYLYSMELSLNSEKHLVDQLNLPFGIRTIAFSSENGFQLNGKNLELIGGCVHHDNGLLGAVALDRAEERKIELLKSNGYNAVRTSHNPPSTKFLEACDELGMLVINEAFDQWIKAKRPDDYHRYFEQYHEKDLESMVLRDRNHPSVIMWSIGNEIQERADPEGVSIANRLKSIILKYDQTRPVTAGICTFWDNPGKSWSDSENAFQSLDVSGYNYVWWEYENDHMKFPERIIYGSETVAKDRSRNLELIEKHPYVIGEFVWTAIDYLGESGLAHAVVLEKGEKDTINLRPWPWFNAWCGDIDICGNRKPQSLYRDVVWGKSMIEIAVHSPLEKDQEEKVSYWGWPDEYPTWNWKGYEKDTLKVRVYSRYPTVWLYLNNQRIGEKQPLETNPWKYTAEFDVKYTSGVIKAYGVEDGTIRDSAFINTTGPAVRIKLTPDRAKIHKSRNDLSYISIELQDENGNLVPDEDQKVAIELEGHAEIAASGNASPNDMESFRSLKPSTFNGRALAIVRPLGRRGKARLTVKPLDAKSNIQPETITITFK